MNISRRQIIRLRRMFPFPRVKLRVRRRDGASGNPQNRVKRCHRIKPTIEPEHVFVEVRLQMFWLDTAMMSSPDPSFQVAENKVDHGQVRLGLLRIAAERQCLMAIPSLSKSWVASPSIGAQDRAKRHVVFDKAGKRIGAAIRHYAKPQPSCIDAAPVLLAIVLARPNLYRSDHDGLVVSAAPFTARLAADHAFIDLDGMLAADGVSFGANHARAELVKYLESSLITRERKLALKLNGRLARDLRGHEVCAPEPRRERRVARLHNGSRRQRRISFAATAAQNYRRASCETIRLAANAAFRTGKSIRPANGLKIAGASRIVRKDPLKLRKRSGEAANVHA
jgi:hypothetical protein